MDGGINALPDNFTAHNLTDFKDRGNTRFPSLNALKLLSIVERAVLDVSKLGKFMEIGHHQSSH